MTDFRYNLGDLNDPALPLDLPAIVDLRDFDQPREYSHADIRGLAGGVARWLQAQGLPRGSRIAIASLNRAEFLISYFGIMRAGYVAVPINIKQPEQTIAYVLQDAHIVLAFVDGARRNTFSAYVRVVDFDDAGPEGFAAQITPAEFESIRPRADEEGQMLYTSGSTGIPKGVPLTHSGQLWALQVTTPPPAEPQRLLLAQPLFHMNGLFMAKRAFALHSQLVILPGFDVDHYLTALERYRINTVTAVPTMFARLIRDPARLQGRDFSSLKRVALASAPMTLDLLGRLKALFPATQFAHGYGTTEAGPAVFGPHPDGIPSPDLAVGHPIHVDHVRLVDGPNENEGVLLMRNPAVLAGYHNLPEKSAQVLHDGWYTSGDVMRRDEQGFYYFIGRADDMFVCSGENIYPVEVEKLLERHPDVIQVSVVPLPDEERAHVPVAFVVRRPGSTLDADTLKRFALDNGPAYQHPRRVRFVAELPWAGTNKVDRHVLIQLARQLEAGQGWLRADDEVVA